MNNKIIITITEKLDYTIIEFNLTENLIPEDLKKFNPLVLMKDVRSDKGIILSGRGPIWLYGFLIHFYHPTKFIAVHDPRLNGAVVIETHSTEHKIGEVIDFKQ